MKVRVYEHSLRSGPPLTKMIGVSVKLSLTTAQGMTSLQKDAATETVRRKFVEQWTNEESVSKPGPGECTVLVAFSRNLATEDIRERLGDDVAKSFRRMLEKA